MCEGVKNQPDNLEHERGTEEESLYRKEHFYEGKKITSDIKR